MIQKKFIFVLFLLIILHYCFTNGLEKIIFKILSKHDSLILRPQENCKNLKMTPVKCLGMPSGHTEITTIICFILYKYNYISLPVLIIIISLMCLQRIFAKKHTFLQTLIGIIFGLFYSQIYLCIGISYETILLALLFIFTYVNIIMLKMNDLLYQKIPEWVSINMIKSINKKRNVPYYVKFISIILSPLRQNIFLYMSWKDLEFYLDKIVDNIKNTNIKYDAVVGIKTGGAIISDYISQKLNIKNYKIKVSKKKYNCNKSPHDFINNYIESYIKKDDSEFIICEGINDNIENKNIILIDELVSSGKTMNTSIEYLIDKKVNIIYPTTIISYNVKLIKNYKLNTILESEFMNTIWSWGYDN